MKKINWILGVLLLAVVVPMLQSCDDDGYSIGDMGWDWATVRTTGGGGYYLEGDHWGIIDPISTTIPWYRPVDGKRVITYFNPLDDMDDNKGIVVKMEGIQEILTKEVEEMTAENEEDFGNDPIVIYEGDMWLGGKFLNLIFHQNIPRHEKHRISLVENKVETIEPLAEDDGYIHLELRYNTYDDVTGYSGWGRVSYNLDKFYSSDEKESNPAFKGFKVKINSAKNGERVVVLSFDHPVGVPEKAKDVHSKSSIE